MDDWGTNYESGWAVSNDDNGSNLSDEESSPKDFHHEDDLNNNEEVRLDPRDFEEISCNYCGINSKDCLIKCKDCQNHFCSSFTNGASHLFYHLILSKHTSIVPLDEDLGDSVECYSCNASNILSLGYVPANEDDLVVVLCRRCSFKKKLSSGESWNIENFNLIVNNKSLVDWLHSEPSDTDLQHAYQIKTGQIRKFEEYRKLNQSWDTSLYSFLSTADVENEKFIPETKDVYDNDLEYKNIYSRLVELEEEASEELAESMVARGIAIKWELHNDLQYALVDPLQIAEIIKVTVGDILHITYPGDTVNQFWEAEAIAVFVPVGANGFVTLAIRSFSEEDENTIDRKSKKMVKPQFTKNKKVGPVKNESIPVHISLGFTLKATSNSIPRDRMLNALDTFALPENCVERSMKDLILGIKSDNDVNHKGTLPSDFSIESFNSLNEYQNEAIRNALTHKISLIQGPPGTGKTVTSAMIVHHMLQYPVKKRSKILVCAPTNIATEHLTDKIASLGINVTRIVSSRLEIDEDNISPHSLSRKVENNIHSEEYSELAKTLRKSGMLEASLMKKFKSLYNKSASQVINDSDVICSTLTSAGSHLLSSVRFSDLIIDEAAQATEPECLIAIVKNPSRIVLIGDHQQLGPVIRCTTEVGKGLDVSLFERFAKTDLPMTKLNIQFRMHPALSDFPSNVFYEGSLRNGVSAYDRTDRVDNGYTSFPWINPNEPMVFVHVDSSEAIGAQGTSILNTGEADVIIACIKRLLKAGVDPEDIGVITPYDAQRAYILLVMEQSPPQIAKQMGEIEVASVNAFQGREKKYILFTCVRSNNMGSIGFLGDPRRLNVAITRAKYGLIVVGNASHLARNRLWHMFIMRFKRKGLLVEPRGSASGAFVKSHISIPNRFTSSAKSKNKFDFYNSNIDSRKGFFTNEFESDNLEDAMKELTFQ